MNESPEIEQQLWELVYGLLTEEETRELQQRIRSDRQLARKYAEICLQADLVANASKLPAPPADLSVSAIDPTSKPTAKSPSTTHKSAPAATVSRKSKAQPWVDRALLALAASLLLLMVGIGPKAMRNVDSSAVAYRYPQVRITTDRPLIEAISSQVKVTVADAMGKPLAMQPRAKIVSPTDQVTEVPVTPGRVAGELSIPLSRNAVIPNSKLELSFDGVESVEVPLPIQSNPVEDVVVLEKNLVSPGEKVHYLTYGRYVIGGGIAKPSTDSVRVLGIDLDGAKDFKKSQSSAQDAPASEPPPPPRGSEIVKGEITIPAEAPPGLTALEFARSGLPVREEPVLIVAPDQQRMAGAAKGSADALAFNSPYRKDDNILERANTEKSAKREMRPRSMQAAPESAPLASALPAAPKVMAAAPKALADTPPPGAAPPADGNAGMKSKSPDISRGGSPPSDPSPSALGALPGFGVPGKTGASTTETAPAGNAASNRLLAEGKESGMARRQGVSGPSGGAQPKELETERLSRMAARSKEKAAEDEVLSNSSSEGSGAMGGLGGGMGNRDYSRQEQQQLAEAPMTGRWLRRGSDANVVLPVPETLANPTSPIQVDIRAGNEVIASQFFDATQIQNGNISVPVPAEIHPPLMAWFFGSNTSDALTVVVPPEEQSTEHFQIVGKREVYQPGQSVELTIEPPAADEDGFSVMGVQVVQSSLLNDPYRFGDSANPTAGIPIAPRSGDKFLFDASPSLGVRGSDAISPEGKPGDSPKMGAKSSEGPTERYFHSEELEKRKRDGLAVAAAQKPILLFDTGVQTRRDFLGEVDQLEKKQSYFRKLFGAGLVGLVLVVLGWSASRVYSQAKSVKHRVATATPATWTARHYWGAGAAFAALLLAMVIWWPNGPLSKNVAMQGATSAKPEADSLPPAPAAAAGKPIVASDKAIDFVQSDSGTVNNESLAAKGPLLPKEDFDSPAEKQSLMKEVEASEAPTALDDRTTKENESAPAFGEAKAKSEQEAYLPPSLFWMTPDLNSSSKRIPIRFTLPEAEGDYTMLVHAVEDGQPVTKQVQIFIRHPELAKEAASADSPSPDPAPASEPKPAPPQPK